MAEVEVPHRFIGKSILDAQIRSKYGVEIVLVKRRLSAEEAEKLHKNEETLIPDASYIIREGDILLIVGSKNKINSFKYSW